MDVEHRAQEMRFVLPIGEHEAELLYFPIDDTTLDFGHTFVPPAVRGSGAGGKIVKAALDYAVEHGLRVRPSCSFVAAFIRRHPEYQEITV